MMEMINLSEGQMKKMINEAEGKASEILTVAKATASSIRQIGEVLMSKGGEEAFQLKLKEKHLNNLRQLADANVEIIIPGSINDYESWVKTVGL